MTADAPADLAFEFGPFRLMPGRRLLLKDGSPFALGGRAMDLLLALVERPGDVLGRKELETRAWPGVVVEETSLRVHMSVLRRKLRDGIDGARYIANVPGRGYCFVAPVARSGMPRPADRLDLPRRGTGSGTLSPAVAQALELIDTAHELLGSALGLLWATQALQAAASPGARHGAAAVAGTAEHDATLPAQDVAREVSETGLA